MSKEASGRPPLPRTRPRTRRRALRTFVALLRAAGRLERASSAHLADAGLTRGRFAVLEALLHLGPLSQGELARRVLSSDANLTTVVDHLERDGLVERRRDPEDGRRRIVHPTPAGLARVRGVFPDHAAGIQDLLSCLDAADQDHLHRLCRDLERGLAERDERC